MYREQIHKLVMTTSQLNNRFQMISPLKTYDNKRQTDILEAFNLVSNGAQVLFLEFKRIMNSKNNIVQYAPPAEVQITSSIAYKMFNRYTVALTKAGLIKRIPRKLQRKLGYNDTNFYYYQINPYLLFPLEDSARDIWRLL